MRVGILGATGLIGQQYMQLLRNHPWFELHAVAGSEESSGKKCEGYTLSSLKDFPDCEIIFSALPNTQAHHYEQQFAERGSVVISSSSAHRLEKDIPLVIPEVNPGHLQSIPSQKMHRKWKGCIVCKPNCSLQSFIVPLAPLHQRFKIKQLSVTTLQAISGAGAKGMASLDIHDNIIPFIKGEEEKTEKEPLKILESAFPISVHCNRVPVMHGHLACVSVAFENNPGKEDILHAWKSIAPLPLPSAPQQVVAYHEEENRPQTRLDRDMERGMGVAVGRLRPCSVLHWKFAALSHNMVRGGAGTGVLIAELMKHEGYLG